MSNLMKSSDIHFSSTECNYMQGLLIRCIFSIQSPQWTTVAHMIIYFYQEKMWECLGTRVAKCQICFIFYFLFFIYLFIFYYYYFIFIFVINGPCPAHRSLLLEVSYLITCWRSPVSAYRATGREITMCSTDCVPVHRRASRRSLDWQKPKTSWWV